MVLSGPASGTGYTGALTQTVSESMQPFVVFIKVSFQQLPPNTFGVRVPCPWVTMPLPVSLSQMMLTLSLSGTIEFKPLSVMNG